jgi:hypothetical protein
VVAHEKGARDSWVILSLHDFRDWFGSDPGHDGAGLGDDPGALRAASGGDPAGGLPVKQAETGKGGGDLRGDPAPAPATVKLQRRPGLQLARPQPVKLTRRAADPAGDPDDLP